VLVYLEHIGSVPGVEQEGVIAENDAVIITHVYPLRPIFAELIISIFPIGFPFHYNIVDKKNGG
jgi:hypothetical protein